MASDDNKIRPNKGAMWFMQMQSDYFDLDFNNTFSGMVSTAHGFNGFIKAYITANYQKTVRSSEIKIKIMSLISTLDDDKLATIEDIKDISQKFMALGRLNTFQISKDKKFVSFGIDKMLQYLDIHSKNATKKQMRFEQLQACADELGIPEVSINDSTRDEWCEYMYTKHFSKAETLKKNGFVIESKWERLGSFNSGTDYLDTSKTKSKKEIHKGKDSKGNQITSFKSNNKDIGKEDVEEDWEVLECDSSIMQLRHKKDSAIEFEITDSDIIANHSLTLQEKVTKQLSRRLEPKNLAK
tara:strand:- start:783 stop:1676 length:894 start_codon:yes stop_codon:yes gene_type:complete